MKIPQAWVPGCCLVVSLIAAGVSHASIIYSNEVFPGDFFTNPSSSNQGQLLGNSGWVYNNVRNDGLVGVNNTYPRDGNGSVNFSLLDGTAKADIEYLAGPTSISGNYAAAYSFGSLTSLTNLSYDWYRDSSSSAPAHLHPVIRVLLDLDGNLLTTGDRGGLVFERAYNGGLAPVPTDTWVTDSVGSTANLWSFGLGGYQSGNYNLTLANWRLDPAMENAVVLGYSIGVGSGWAGTFDGAADNIGWTLGGTTTSRNFEVVIPEPGSLALGLLGAVSLLRRKR